MDRSSLTVVVMPITTLISLFTGVTLPFIALTRADQPTRPGAAGRKARPQKPGADDAAPARYLYVPCVRIRSHGEPAQTRRWVQQVPIVKRRQR